MSQNSRQQDLKSHPLGLMDKHRGHPTVASLLEENQALHNHLKYYNHKLTRMIDYRGYSETMERVRTGKKSAMTEKDKRMRNLLKEAQNNEKHLAIQMSDIRRMDSKRDRLTNPSHLADINRDIMEIGNEIAAVKKEIHNVEVENKKETRGTKDKYRSKKGSGSAQISSLLKEIDLVSRKNQDIRQAIDEGTGHIDTQNEYYDDKVAKKEREVKEQMDKVGVAVETDYTREYKLLQKAIEDYKQDTQKLEKRHDKGVKMHQKELEEITLGYEIIQRQVDELNLVIEKQVSDLYDMIELAKTSQSPHGMKILDRIKDGISGNMSQDESREERREDPFGNKYSRLSRPSYSNGEQGSRVSGRVEVMPDRPRIDYRDEVSTMQRGSSNFRDSKPRYGELEDDEQRLLEEKMNRLDEKRRLSADKSRLSSHSPQPMRNKSAAPEPERRDPVMVTKPRDDEMDWLGTGKAETKRDPSPEPAKKSPFGPKFKIENNKSRDLEAEKRLADLKNSEVRITEERKMNEELSVPDMSKRHKSQVSVDPDLDMILGDPAFQDNPKQETTPKPVNPGQSGPKTLPTQITPKPVIGGPGRPINIGGPKPVVSVNNPGQTKPVMTTTKPVVVQGDPLAGLVDLDEVPSKQTNGLGKPRVQEVPKKSIDFDGFGDDDDEPKPKMSKKKNDDPFGFLEDDTDKTKKVKDADSDIFGDHKDDDIFGDARKKNAAKPTITQSKPVVTTAKKQETVKPQVSFDHSRNLSLKTSLTPFSQMISSLTIYFKLYCFN